jgi:hypothetical protein
MEPRIGELREDYALRNVPTAAFAANPLYLEIVRLASNLVTAFQCNCIEESCQNRPTPRLIVSPPIENLADDMPARIDGLPP